MRWPDARPLALAALAAAAPVLVAVQRPRPAAPPAESSDGGETPRVFRRYAAEVVKIQVVEAGAEAKEVTGTAFFVTPQGHLLTNYHVVAGLVHRPGRYRAELLDGTGTAQPVRVVAVDAVHDLAVLASRLRPARWFALDGTVVVQGQRLWSLGHPGDLGIAIVEGTYNGRLPHTLYPRMHFTGAINPGMSGGPTITLDGHVVGVNVATAGNEQGFLVPVEDAAALLHRALVAPDRPVDSLLGDVGRQLLAYQDTYLRSLLADSTPTVVLGGWRLPTRPTDVFNCWGEADRRDDRPWEVVHHYCTTGDDVFITADQSSGIVEFEHEAYTSTRLNRFQFTSLLAQHFRSLPHDWELEREGDEQVTGYRCRSGNVRQQGAVLKVVLCARRYRRLPGLYDVVVRAATLGRSDAGVLSTITMAGVSFENALTVARRYLGAIRWTGWR